MEAVSRRSSGRGSGAELPSVMFLSPRRELRGWGEALRIEVPAPWAEHLGVVSEALVAIESTSEVGPAPGSGPIAFAALPFDRGAAATFIVPQLVRASTSDGEHWTTELVTPHTTYARYVLGEHNPGRDITGQNEPESDPEKVNVRSVVPPHEWCELVAAATRRISAGELQKVVLARELVVTADAPFDPHVIAHRLAATHPHAFRFDVDGFVGASPELLVSRFGDVVRAHPMAGTTPRSGDPDVDNRMAAELLHSAKNRDEHSITIDMVLDTLLGFTSFVDAAPDPAVVAAGTVQHLATMVEGRLSDPPASVLDLVAALHPTPAVGGFPRQPALDLIAELEPSGRGRYGGPVGWVDSAGNGAWAVGLRAASIEGVEARLFAGVGVVADSDPFSELAETQAKFASTLGVITRL